jgi:hypothetical protein
MIASEMKSRGLSEREYSPEGLYNYWWRTIRPRYTVLAEATKKRSATKEVGNEGDVQASDNPIDGDMVDQEQFLCMADQLLQFIKPQP